MKKNEQQNNIKELHYLILEKMQDILITAGLECADDLSIKEVKGEDANLVFRLENAGRSYALKIFSNSGDNYFTNKKFNELATANNVPTPAIVFASDNGEPLNTPWIIWDWVDGQPSCNLEDENDRAQAAFTAGQKLRKMHQIRVDGFGSPDAEGKWSADDARWNVDFFVNRLKRLNQQADHFFDDGELERILIVTADSPELLSFTNPVLLHGDITGGNVILTATGDISLIDPGENIAGDPMADLGYSQTTRLSPVFRKNLWKGYVSEKPLTSDEYKRFARWRLLRQCIIACRAAVSGNENARQYHSDAINLLEEIESTA